jgi:hypothetical protein
VNACHRPVANESHSEFVIHAVLCPLLLNIMTVMLL